MSEFLGYMLDILSDPVIFVATVVFAVVAFAIPRWWMLLLPPLWWLVFSLWLYRLFWGGEPGENWQIGVGVAAVFDLLVVATAISLRRLVLRGAAAAHD